LQAGCLLAPQVIPRPEQPFGSLGHEDLKICTNNQPVSRHEPSALRSVSSQVCIPGSSRMV
jgi:hypothetical protein